jgi:Complex I intermediate-associated protein 30 (CIA30)
VSKILIFDNDKAHKTTVMMMMMMMMSPFGGNLSILCVMLAVLAGGTTASSSSTVSAAVSTATTTTLRRSGAFALAVVEDKDNDDKEEVNSSIVVLESFDNPQHEWVAMLDPVMGGASTGTFTIDRYSGIGVLQGHVAIVPFLQAPGFILAETSQSTAFPDVSTCRALQLTLRSLTTPTYSGFRVSFGTRPIPNFQYGHGYKASFHVPPSSSSSSSFVTVTIPWGDFTIDWDAGTGDSITTCAENADYCPDVTTLQNMQRLALWAEGVEGNVDLQVQSIAATQCHSSSGSHSRSAFVQGSAGQQEPMEALVRDNAGDADEELHEIVIQDFGTNASPPKISWTAMNDPVMGGKSKATVAIDKDAGVAIFDGQVVNVPFLKAPGFVTMRGTSSSTDAFPDVRSCAALQLVLRSNSDDEQQPEDAAYQGYRLSFGNAHVPGGRFAYGYKTPFTVPIISSLHDDDDDSSATVNVVLPFSDFSDNWDDATGDIKVPCSDDNPQYCPDVTTLQNMKTLSLWGEGVAGFVHLEVVRISAVGCSNSSSSSITTTTTTDFTSTTTAALAQTTTTTDWSSMINTNGGESNTNSVVSPAAVAPGRDNSNNNHHHFVLGTMMIVAVAAASMLWNSHKRQQRRREYEELISTVRHELFY